jgi:U3 small nucleolar RNA-associated protein MPP10
LIGWLDWTAESTRKDDVYYRDFFSPPKKKKREDGGSARQTRVKFDEQVRVKEIRPPKQVAVTVEHARSVIERVKDDVFHEELSAHQIRVASIAEQIKRLEAENVGDREWSLMGEAASKNRPYNSLLEEDLDYEQLQRPVTAVTTESNSSLENLIKSRILEVNFISVFMCRLLTSQ